VLTRTIEPSRHIDLHLTLGPLRRGLRDPTMRTHPGVAERASRTPDGPVSVRFAGVDGRIDVEAWGDGAAWTLEHAPAWCGAEDARLRSRPMNWAHVTL